MDIRKLQRAIVDGLEDVKAQAITVFNTEALSPLFERVIVATGASNRQTKSLAASVRDKVRERGMQVMRTEGEENGEWIIVDCGAAVVHIMQPSIREYYNLEEIWGGKPVKMKLGGGRAGQGLVKASEDFEADEDVAAPAPSRRAAVGTKTAPKTVPRKGAVARRPSTPRQPPGKKGSAKSSVRTVVVGKPARKATAKAAVKAGAPASRRRA
jgi:ribosome-associated protein